MAYTKEMVKEKILKDDAWLKRGILAIWKCQTPDEQSNQATCYLNNTGFNGADASFLSSIAEQINKGRSLSEKQILVARKKMVKYAGQLAKIANGVQVVPVAIEENNLYLSSEEEEIAQRLYERRKARYQASAWAASKQYRKEAFKYCSR